MNRRYRVLYKFPAGAEYHCLMRAEMPADLRLLTLDSEERAELCEKSSAADFVIPAKLNGVAVHPNLLASVLR